MNFYECCELTEKVYLTYTLAPLWLFYLRAQPQGPHYLVTFFPHKLQPHFIGSTTVKFDDLPNYIDDFLYLTLSEFFEGPGFYYRYIPTISANVRQKQKVVKNKSICQVSSCNDSKGTHPI